MPGLVIVILGIGSLALYFSFKIFANKCKPDYPIEIQNHINSLRYNEKQRKCHPSMKI